MLRFHPRGRTIRAPRHPVAVVSFVIAFLLVPALPVSAAEPEAPLPAVRAHGILFDVPEGWKQTTGEDGRIILAPAREMIGVAQIHVAPVETGKAALRDYLDADLEAGRKNFKNFAVEGEVVAGKHPRGYDVVSQLISFEEQTQPWILRKATMFARINHVDAGPGASQPILFLARGRENYDKYRDTFEAFLRSARVPAREVLAAAPAGSDQLPLTLESATRFAEFLEWVMDAPLAPEQRAVVHESLVRTWQSGQAQEISAAVEMPKFRAKLEATMSAEKTNAIRLLTRGQMLKVWRAGAGNDPLARTLVAIHDKAHPPLAEGKAGEPPLTRQAADASLDTYYFMAGKVAGPGEDVSAPAADKDRFAEQLAAGYADMKPEDKDVLAGMPGMLAGLKATWPELSPELREQAVAQWSELAPVKPLVERVRDVRRIREGDRVGRLMKEEETRQMLFHMGALRMNHTYIKW